MKFKYPHLSLEFDHCHPELRALALEFEEASRQNGWPEPEITSIFRTLDFYEKNDLKPNLNSWHLFKCAMDYSVREYTPEIRALVIRWWEERVLKEGDSQFGKKWELITKLHGTGPHIHIARRDFAWKEKYGPQKRSS